MRKTFNWPGHSPGQKIQGRRGDDIQKDKYRLLSSAWYMRCEGQEVIIICQQKRPWMPWTRNNGLKRWEKELSLQWRWSLGPKLTYRHETRCFTAVLYWNEKESAQNWKQVLGLSYGLWYWRSREWRRKVLSCFWLCYTLVINQHRQTRRDVCKAIRRAKFFSQWKTGSSSVPWSSQAYGQRMLSKKTVKPNRSLYGVKDAACIWHTLIKESFAKAGLGKTHTALCTFTSKYRTVARYVDDTMISAEHESTINQIKQKIGTGFQFTRARKAVSYFGMEIDWSYRHAISMQ